MEERPFEILCISKSGDIQGEGVHWIEEGMHRSSNREEQIMIIYSPKHDSYDTLPPYAYQWFSMAVINNQLVLVGGRLSRVEILDTEFNMLHHYLSHFLMHYQLP
jgi:hypothetical protein